jgi:hypothetical protein
MDEDEVVHHHSRLHWCCLEHVRIDGLSECAWDCIWSGEVCTFKGIRQRESLAETLGM